MYRKEYIRKWKDKNPNKVRLYERNAYWSLRKKVFDKLGHCCVRCGYKDERALQIDHINGDGKLERSCRNRIYMYKVLKDTSGKFQILCANCNQIKKIENRENYYAI